MTTVCTSVWLLMCSVIGGEYLSLFPTTLACACVWPSDWPTVRDEIKAYCLSIKNCLPAQPCAQPCDQPCLRAALAVLACCSVSMYGTIGKTLLAIDSSGFPLVWRQLSQCRRCVCRHVPVCQTGSHNDACGCVLSVLLFSHKGSMDNVSFYLL